MEPHKITSFKSRILSATLILSAILFYSIGIFSLVRFDPRGGTIFIFGLATLLVSFAVNPVALETPREGFNWKLIPRHAKVLQIIAILLLTAGMVILR